MPEKKPGNRVWTAIKGLVVDEELDGPKSTANFNGVGLEHKTLALGVTAAAVGVAGLATLSNKVGEPYFAEKHVREQMATNHMVVLQTPAGIEMKVPEKYMQLSEADRADPFKVAFTFGKLHAVDPNTKKPEHKIPFFVLQRGKEEMIVTHENLAEVAQWVRGGNIIRTEEPALAAANTR